MTPHSFAGIRWILSILGANKAAVAKTASWATFAILTVVFVCTFAPTNTQDTEYLFKYLQLLLQDGRMLSEPKILLA